MERRIEHQSYHVKQMVRQTLKFCLSIGSHLGDANIFFYLGEGVQREAGNVRVFRAGKRKCHCTNLLPKKCETLYAFKFRYPGKERQITLNNSKLKFGNHATIINSRHLTV